MRISRNSYCGLCVKSSEIQLTTLVYELNKVAGKFQRSDPDDDSTQKIKEHLQTKEQAIDICATILYRVYSGDPMTLDAFIDSINLLEDLIVREHIDILRHFILSKLVGEARLAIWGQTSSISDIKNALRINIKPVAIEGIEARLLALKFNIMAPR